MDSTRVVVVDDHVVVREGLVALVSRERDLHVVGSFASAGDAVDELDSLAPDVVVLDQCLQGMSGATACREVLRIRPQARVVMLTTSARDDVLYACLAAGARGYLLKGAPAEDIIRSIRAVVSGELVLAPELVERVVRWIRSPGVRLGNDELAPPEMMTLSLIAEGRSNREVARSLGVTEGAVRTYVQTVKRKLGVSCRSEAVAAGIRRGVI